MLVQRLTMQYSDKLLIPVDSVNKIEILRSRKSPLVWPGIELAPARFVSIWLSN